LYKYFIIIIIVNFIHSFHFYKQLQQEISNALTAGVQYFFDHVHYYNRVFNIKKENKKFSVTISDVARKSLKGLLLIFKDDFEKGRRN